MSNDPLRSISARDAVVALERSESGNNSDFNRRRGHSEEIQDTVAISVNAEPFDRLFKSKTLDEVLELLPHEKREKRREEAKDNVETPKEKVLEYLKLPGERIDQPYVYEAARAAFLELLVEKKGELPPTEETIKNYAVLFDRILRQKEGSPTNQPDVRGETQVEAPKFA